MKTKSRAEKARKKSGPSKRVGSGRLVGVLRAEIENLRRDAARLDALERLWRREIHLTREMTEMGDWCVVKVWSTKYLSSYNYEGESVRDALDDLMAKHPNSDSQTASRISKPAIG